MVRSHISKLNKMNIWNDPDALMSSISYLGLLFLYSTVIASNILLVDEIMRAGMSSLKG